MSLCLIDNNPQTYVVQGQLSYIILSKISLYHSYYSPSYLTVQGYLDVDVDDEGYIVVSTKVNNSRFDELSFTVSTTTFYTLCPFLTTRILRYDEKFTQHFY